MTDTPTWADLFERADRFEVTTEQISAELTALRETDE
jgi:hypothetical protein